MWRELARRAAMSIIHDRQDEFFNRPNGVSRGRLPEKWNSLVREARYTDKWITSECAVIQARSQEAPRIGCEGGHFYVQPTLRPSGFRPSRWAHPPTYMFGCLADTILIAGAKGCCLNRLIHRMESEKRGMLGAGLLISPALNGKRALRSWLVLFSYEESASNWRTTDEDSSL